VIISSSPQLFSANILSLFMNVDCDTTLVVSLISFFAINALGRISLKPPNTVLLLCRVYLVCENAALLESPARLFVETTARLNENLFSSCIQSPYQNTCCILLVSCCFWVLCEIGAIAAPMSCRLCWSFIMPFSWDRLLQCGRRHVKLAARL